MMMEDYEKAQKAGERAYSEAISRGEYPYLQALQEILPHEETVSEVKLGLQEIPLSAVKGTYAAGRRTAFACNFMPLLSEETEFAQKWMILNEAHLNEGIKVPVKAYEYMHSYYIMEGNKRVSVLKFNGALTVMGNVYRIIPPRTSEKRNRVYFEYLNFYKLCPVLFLEFTSPGAYADFQKLAGKKPDESWSESERIDIRSMYNRFVTAYTELRGDEFKTITPSDAFLCYLKLFGFNESKDTLPGDYKKNLQKIWQEIVLLTKPEQVDVVLDDPEAPKENFLVRLFKDNDEERKLKIAFMYLKSPDKSAWSYGHELGRQTLENIYGKQITTAVYSDIAPEKSGKVFEEIIEGGADIIFATSQLFMKEAIMAAVRHPEVKIYNCGVNVAHKYISTYHARLYEAKYLSGIIAGALAGNDDVGIVADNPSYGAVANVNAFALGVQAVNKNIRVHVQWNGAAGSNPDAYFEEHNIKIISGRDIYSTSDSPRKFGLYRKNGTEIENLALATRNWGVLYEKLVKSVLNRTYEATEKESGHRAVNYWWGFKSDVIDLFIGKGVPYETEKLIKFLETGIRNGTFLIFSGKLNSQTGPVSDDEGYIMNPIEIASIDWLNSNIVGTIPDISVLTPEAAAIVQMMLDTEEKEN